MEENRDSLGHLIESLRNIKLREELELLKLMEDPSRFNLCQAIFDKVHGILSCLMQYEKLVDCDGREAKVMEVTDEMEDWLDDLFKRITGKDYRPDMLRNIETRRFKEN